MTANVLFFDVDGPMVSGRALFLPGNIERSYGWEFDPCAVGMLNFLGWCVPDLQIVIASHRIGMRCEHTASKGTQMYQDWVDIFKHNKLNVPLHRDWVTKRVEETRPKIIEIAEWMKAHPEVQRFVTIDDEAAGYDRDPTAFEREKFHLCAEDYLNGMTWSDLVRAAKFLGIKNIEQARDKYCKHIIKHGHHAKTNSGSFNSGIIRHPDFPSKIG